MKLAYKKSFFSEEIQKKNSEKHFTNPAKAKLSNERMRSELKVADEALDRVQQPTSFLVQSQREKASEAARLRETVKIQNKKIIDQEETIDRLRQVWLIHF